MGYTGQYFIPPVGDIEEVGLRLPNPFQNLQDPSPIGHIQSMAGFVGDEQDGALHHGPGQKDHSLLSEG